MRSQRGATPPLRAAAVYASPGLPAALGPAHNVCGGSWWGVPVGPGWVVAFFFLTTFILCMKVKETRK